MRRILHITYGLARNGTETFIMNLYRAVDKSNYKFDFLISRNKKDGYYQEAKDSGSEIFCIPFTRKNILRNLIKLIKFFHKNRNYYDAIHYSANTLCAIEVLIIARLCGIKNIITHVHSSKAQGFQNILMHRLYKFFIPFISKQYLACSDSAATFGYPKIISNKVKVISNGIDLVKYKYNDSIRIEKRKELGINEELTIGIVARISPVKNHEFLIDIFNEIVKQKPNAYLVIVGEGELKDSIKQKVKDLNIEQRVKFIGLRSDIPHLLNSLDAFVLPSLYEGLPFVAIESQANGLSTFISDVVSDQILLTPFLHKLSLHQSSKDWADYILNNLNKNRNFKVDNYLIKNYSIEDTVNQIIKVYKYNQNENCN